MALLKKLIGGRSRALPVGRGVPFRRPIRGRPTPPISIDRPPLTPSLGGARPVQEGPLPLPVNPADDIVSALPVGPSIPFTPPTDTNELPTARPIPGPTQGFPAPKPLTFIQQLPPGRPQPPISIGGPSGGRPRPIAIGRPVAPPGGLRPLPIQPPNIGGIQFTSPNLKQFSQGPLAGLVQNVNASGGFGQPLVPGSGTPPPQTGLTAAELLELSDEELQRYIPRETIGQGVGSTRRTYDATPSPEEFRKRLQREINPDPNDPRPFGTRRYNLVDQSPAPTREPIFARPQPPMSIGGPGGSFDDGGGGVGTGLPIDAPIQGPIRPPQLEPIGSIQQLIPERLGSGPGGNDADRFRRPLPPLSRRGGGFEPEPVIPIDPITGLADLTAGEPRTEVTDTLARPIPGQIPFLRDDLVFAGGSPTFDERGEKFVPPPVPDPVPDPIPQPATDPTVTETTTGATDPTVTATTTDVTDPVQTIPTPPGSVDPIITTQTADEVVTDPLIRALYFGTPDQPGFFNQLQQAGANLIGSDVPLQQTAGLTPLELLARQQAVAGLGGFEPFFQQNKDLIDQAIGQSRRAEALRDPYFQRAEQQMLLGLGDQLGGIDEARGITLGATDRFGRSLGRIGRQQIGATDAFGRRLSDVEARGEGAAGRFGQALGGIEAGAIGSTDMFGRRLGESEDLLRGTLGGYDQGLTQQFYNPFEDRVVQQTIADITEDATKRDIAQRAQDIGRGGLSAFGSRGRLTAGERQEALGRGLGEALAGIRAGGFSEAQRAGLSEFARQRDAERAASQGLSSLAGSRLGAESGLFDRLTSGAQQRLAAEQGVVDLLGRTGQQQLGAQQQLGSTLRGLTGDQFSAQQQLAADLLGFGSAGAGARQNLASGLLGIGQQRGAGAQQLGQSLAGFGQQIGDIGSQLEALRRGQRGELAGFGGIGRGIAETGLSRLFAQQFAQQQRPLDVIGRIGQMLPGYTQATSRIGTTYGMPQDPSALGLGAALSAYSSFAPQTGSVFANYGQTTGQG